MIQRSVSPTQTTWYPHSNLQYLADLLTWTAHNGMEINTSKTKEMVLGRLANTNLPLPNITSQTVQRVTAYKLLGVHIDSTLSLSTHIEHIIKNATARLYFLKQLKRAGLLYSHLLHFYITVIRPVLEFRAPVWHNALTKAQSESLESLQKARYPYYPQPNPRNDVFHPCCFTQMWFRWLHGVFFVTLWILPPVFTASFLHPDPPLSLKAQIFSNSSQSLYSYKAILFLHAI